MLQIQPAGVSDSGHYTCVATNAVGEDDRDFIVHVQGEPWAQPAPRAGGLSKSRGPRGSLEGAEKGEQERSLSLLENNISSPVRADAVDAAEGRCPCSPQLTTACPRSAPHLPAANKPQRSP